MSEFAALNPLIASLSPSLVGPCDSPEISTSPPSVGSIPGSSEEAPTHSRKRTRKIIGPVKGNNSTGRVGKLKCTECRRIRSKCVYESEDSPCEYCVEHDRPCTKVWGPQRNTEAQSGSDVVTALSTYPVSLIADSNLSARDLYYLRYLVANNSACCFTALGTIFRYLWTSFGFNLASSSPLLRYSAMASAAMDISCRSGGAIPLEYYEYVSLFHDGLLSAIKENNVDETHLFALSLAVHNPLLYSLYPSEASAPYYTYLNLFCATLDHLIANTQNCPPKPIWSFTLLFLRRTYAYPQGLTAIDHDSDTQLYRMHLLNTRLPAPNNFDGMFEPSFYFTEEGSDFAFRYFWDVTDILCSLQSNFRILYRHRSNEPSNTGADNDFAQLLEAVRTRTNGFERLRYMDDLFEVRSITGSIDQPGSYKICGP